MSIISGFICVLMPTADAVGHFVLGRESTRGDLTGVMECVHQCKPLPWSWYDACCRPGEPWAVLDVHGPVYEHGLLQYWPKLNAVSHQHAHYSTTSALIGAKFILKQP